MTRRDMHHGSTVAAALSTEISLLGRRIQERRIQRSITLDMLAQRTGFSKGYLSRIENGKKTPPLSTLGRIAQALSIDLHALLMAPAVDDAPFYRVLRAGERRLVERPGSAYGYRFEALGAAPGPGHMLPFLVQLPRDIDRHMFCDHEGEQFVYLLNGRAELQVGHEQYLLDAGDALSLDSRLPHRARAVDGDAQALLVLLPRAVLTADRPALPPRTAPPLAAGESAAA